MKSIPSGRADPQSRKFVVVLIACWLLSWVGMKISLPALPYLEGVFEVSSDTIRASVAAFLASFALAQGIWGLITDHYGRRAPLLIGIGIAATGTVLVIVSPNVSIYILGRCLEGLGLGCVSPIGRAVLFETRTKVIAASTLTIVSISTALMPAIAQIVGGYIMFWIGWRWIFAFFLLLTIAVFLWVFMEVRETYPKTERRKHIDSKRKLIKTIIANPRFWGYLGCYASCSGTLLGYYAAMPYWYINDWGFGAQQYGLLACFNVVGYVTAILIARRLLGSGYLRWVLPIGMLIALVPGGLMFLFAGVGWESSWAPVIASTVLACMAGFTFPFTNAAAMAPIHVGRGMASAVMITCIFFTAAIMAYTLGSVSGRDFPMIGLLLIIPPTIGLFLLLTLARIPFRKALD